MANLVKVKILKHVGQWSPGDVVEVPEPLAKQLCTVSTVNNGHKIVPHQKAMLHSDAEALASAPVKMEDLTQGDMAQMGIKNVVQSPKYSDLERKLKTDATQAVKKESQEVKAESPAPKPKKSKKAAKEEQAQAV